MRFGVTYFSDKTRNRKKFRPPARKAENMKVSEFYHALEIVARANPVLADKLKISAAPGRGPEELQKTILNDVVKAEKTTKELSAYLDLLKKEISKLPPNANEGDKEYLWTIMQNEGPLLKKISEKIEGLRRIFVIIKPKRGAI
jgi:hypothetical protein